MFFIRCEYESRAIGLCYVGLSHCSRSDWFYFLVKSESFTKLWPSVAVVVLFSMAFYLLSQVIKVIPLGIAYAIWAGVGIVLTALIGFFVFRQSLDVAAMVGIGLIVSGVVVINLFSNATGH